MSEPRRCPPHLSALSPLHKAWQTSHNTVHQAPHTYAVRRTHTSSRRPGLAVSSLATVTLHHANITASTTTAFRCCARTRTILATYRFFLFSAQSLKKISFAVRQPQRLQWSCGGGIRKCEVRGEETRRAPGCLRRFSTSILASKAPNTTCARTWGLEEVRRDSRSLQCMGKSSSKRSFSRDPPGP